MAQHFVDQAEPTGNVRALDESRGGDRLQLHLEPLGTTATTGTAHNEIRAYVNAMNLPVIQAGLRHAKPSTTAKYIHRNNAVQINAQSKIL